MLDSNKDSHVDEGFVYEPADDSLLLMEAVKYARGDVLELFAGSGVVGLAAAEKAKNVILADINEDAIHMINKRIEEKGLANCKAVKSDLFSGLNGKVFDVIYMNPPYLPDVGREKNSVENALVGGEEGYEITLEALHQSRDHLRSDGEIYLIISSVYDVRNVYKAIKSINFEFEVLNTKKFFFEELLLVKIYEERRDSGN